MRTHRHISPLERMIDTASGHRRGSDLISISVRVRCPGCKQVGTTPAEAAFPDETAVIEVECPKCNPALDGRVVRFLNAEGIVIAGDPLISESSETGIK